MVAKRISDFMKANDMRYAKTIVFCEDIPHCQEMVRLLENENADLVAEDSRYIMQITGDNEVGKAQLDNFIDPSSKYPVIAVTSRLMSTGVDAETCEIIALDRIIGSMTEFKQIIGRGTRIKQQYECDGGEKSKMYFTILDFRKNYLKFNDPAFDGTPVTVTSVPEGNAYFAAYIIIILVSFLLISLDEFSLTTNFTAVLACFNNVGPGFDGVGPTCSFAAYSGFSKLVLTMDMLAGRLEIFPILALFSRGSWTYR